MMGRRRVPPGSQHGRSARAGRDGPGERTARGGGEVRPAVDDAAQPPVEAV